jgi:hypothetical protein
MRRQIIGLGIALALGCSATTAFAEWTFFQRFWLDARRNNVWPEPFQTADRQLARAPFEIMANNGWRLQNTIGDALFDPDTDILNRAGELKVKWILTQNPEHRRIVFVLRCETEVETQARLESVQVYVSKLFPAGELPCIELTDRDVPGVPGQYLDDVDTAYRKTIPQPRLPAMQNKAPGSGTSGS